MKTSLRKLPLPEVYTVEDGLHKVFNFLHYGNRVSAPQIISDQAKIAEYYGLENSSAYTVIGGRAIADKSAKCCSVDYLVKERDAANFNKSRKHKFFNHKTGEKKDFDIAQFSVSRLISGRSIYSEKRRISPSDLFQSAAGDRKLIYTSQAVVLNKVPSRKDIDDINSELDTKPSLFLFEDEIKKVSYTAQVKLHERIENALRDIYQEFDVKNSAEMSKGLADAIMSRDLIWPPVSIHSLEVPSLAPELYQGLRESENPPQFVKRVYGKWLGQGLDRAHIKHLDPILYAAIHNWLKRPGNAWPADVDLPTRAERNQRLLDAGPVAVHNHLGKFAGDELLREAARLRAAKRNRQ